MPNGIFVAARYFFLTPDTAMNKKFVKTYQERFKELPDYMAIETYAGVYFIKAAVERAGTLNADKIVAAVEREPLAWETPEGWKIMRKEDHAVVEDVVWGETAFSDKYGFAILKKHAGYPGRGDLPNPDELKAVRDNSRRRRQGSRSTDLSPTSFECAEGTELMFQVPAGCKTPRSGRNEHIHWRNLSLMDGDENLGYFMNSLRVSAREKVYHWSFRANIKHLR